MSPMALLSLDENRVNALSSVIPAKAGIHRLSLDKGWTPAFAGVTSLN